MRLNVCVRGSKVRDDPAPKRDTESVSSESSREEPRRLTPSLEPRKARHIASYTPTSHGFETFTEGRNRQTMQQ